MRKSDKKKLQVLALFLILFLLIDVGLILSHNLIFAVAEWSGLIFSIIMLLINYVPTPELQIKFDPRERKYLGEWVDSRIVGGMRKFARAEIWNIGDKTAKDCIATLEVLEGPNGFKEYYLEPKTLHWIDAIERKTVLVNIQKGLCHPLDIIFSHQDKPGAYIASSLSVSDTLYSQDYLIPGNYIVEVKVQGENADSVTAHFKVTSGISYKDLYVDIAP